MIDTSKIDWGVIHMALMHAIKTNSGIGFHNSDQGHTAYRRGACDESGGMEDSPDKNRLYQTLRELNRERGPLVGYPEIHSWRAFCEFATRSHDKVRQRCS